MANDKGKEPVTLGMWAASLVAHREAEDGYQIGHKGQLIHADSEEEAEQIAFQLAREHFPEVGFRHSVALNQIEWHAPTIGPLSVTIQLGKSKR